MVVYGSEAYRNEFVAEGLGLTPQTSDTLLLKALLICFRAFIDVGLSPSKQTIDESG